MSSHLPFIVTWCSVAFLLAGILGKAETADTATSSLIQAALKGDTSAVTLLILNNANVNEKSKGGITPLIAAASQGHTDVVRLLLDKQARINDESGKNISALTVAIWNGDEKTAKLLIASGADSVTLFTELASCGNFAMIQHLKNLGANINGQNKEGKSPLFRAAQSGHAEAVSLLIRAGANINAKNTKNEITAVMAATLGCHEEVVKTLINAGADVNIQRKDPADAPLHVALWLGNEKIVKMLLEAGANVSAKDINGLTPLEIAKKKGHTQIIGLLNANSTDNNNLNPLKKETLEKNTEIVKLQTEADAKKTPADLSKALFIAIEEGNKQTVKELIAAGVNVNAKDKQGNTALLIASRFAQRELNEISHILLEAGADVNAKNNNGETSLMLACNSSNINIITKLIEAGADINAKDKQGETALLKAKNKNHDQVVKVLTEAIAKKTKNKQEEELFRAIENGKPTIVRKLISEGVNINAKKDNGMTALYLATEKGHFHIVRLLLEAGADVNAALNKKGNDKGGQTPLFVAVQKGDTNIVRQLIKWGANARYEDIDHKNVIYYAHNKSIQKFLNEASRSSYQFSSFMNRNDLNEIKKLLLRDLPINWWYSEYYTLLMYAAKMGEEDVVDLLLKKGALVNLKNMNGKTAMDYANSEKIEKRIKAAGGKKGKDLP